MSTPHQFTGKGGFEIHGGTDPTDAVEAFRGSGAARLRSSESRRRNLQTYGEAYTDSTIRVVLGDFDTASVKQRPDETPVVRIPDTRYEQLATDYEREKFDQKIQYAMTVHELGHILYTPSQYVHEKLTDLPKRQQKSAKNLWNALEDGAIEEQLRHDLGDSIAERLATLHANLAEAQLEEANFPITYRILPAVNTACLDIGRYDSGILRGLRDDDDERYVWANDEHEALFEDFFGEIEQAVQDVLTASNPYSRTDRIFEFWDGLMDHLDMNDAEEELDQPQQGDQSQQGQQGDQGQQGQQNGDQGQMGNRGMPDDTDDVGSQGQPQEADDLGDETDEEDVRKRIRSVTKEEPQTDTSDDSDDSSSTDQPDESGSTGDDHQSESTDGDGKESRDERSVGDEGDREGEDDSDGTASEGGASSIERETTPDEESSENGDGGSDVGQARSDEEGEDGDDEASGAGENADDVDGSGDSVGESDSKTEGSDEGVGETDEGSEDGTGGSDNSQDSAREQKTLSDFDSPPSNDDSTSEGSDGNDSAEDAESTAGDEAQQDNEGVAPDGESDESEAEGEEDEEGNDAGAGDGQEEDDSTTQLGEETGSGDSTESSDSANSGSKENDSNGQEPGTESGNTGEQDRDGDDQQGGSSDKQNGGEEDGGGDEDSNSENDTDDAGGPGEESSSDEEDDNETDTPDSNAPPGTGEDGLETTDSDDDALDKQLKKERQETEAADRPLEDSVGAFADILDDGDDDNDSDASSSDGAGDADIESLEFRPAPNKEFQREAWTDAKDQSRNTARLLERELKREQRDDHRRGLPTGTIDGSQLFGIESGNLNVMQQRHPGKQKDYHVMIVLDRSTSMRGSDIATAEEAVVEFALALERLGIGVCIMDMHDNTARLISPFHVDTERSKEALMNRDVSGGTPLDEALAIGRQRLDMMGGSTFMLMVTDGKPGDTQSYVEELQNCYMPVLGINLALGESREQAMDRLGGQKRFYDANAIVTSDQRLEEELEYLIHDIAF